MPRLRSFIAAGFITSCVTILAWSQSAPKAGELQVHATYSGSGAIDKQHKFYVVLWDNPDFRKQDGPKPMAFKPVMSKEGMVKFLDVTKTPVYVSLAYDPTGKWDASVEPPAGSSLGLYTKGSSDPAPIEIVPGKTTKVSVNFDDSFKMPQH